MLFRRRDFLPRQKKKKGNGGAHEIRRFDEVVIEGIEKDQGRDSLGNIGERRGTR